MELDVRVPPRDNPTPADVEELSGAHETPLLVDIYGPGYEFTYMVFGRHEAKTIEQFELAGKAAGGRAFGVLSADGHLGYAHPIGGCIGYQGHISLSGVGFDVGCGNLAVKTDLTVDELLRGRRADVLNDIADEIAHRISFGMGRSNETPVEDQVLDDIERSDIAEVRSLAGLARRQLGTVGAGNHYVDVFADEQGAVWVGCHFGSRGFGHKIASGFMNLATGRAFGDKFVEGGMMAPPVLVDVETPLGQDYLEAMMVAGRFAEAGRAWVVDEVLRILGNHGATEYVSNHHNYAWFERHFGHNLYVVRKGCTPAYAGQQGFVGGSMGDQSVVLKGTDSPLSIAAMRTTVHGAGRILSRSKAAGKRRKERRPDGTVKITRERGEVNWGAVRGNLADRGIVLRGGAADEAPQCYRALADVLRAQGPTIEVQHTLSPLVVVMAGADVPDDYRD